MKRLFAIAAILLVGALGLQSAALAADAVVPHVMVLPFTPTGNPGTYDWVGKGIQQSLLADLSGLQVLQLTFATAQPAATGQEPGNSLALAKGAGANFVVIGGYQINDSQIRITGEIYDVSASKSVGGIKATGMIADLFKLEDSLNDQLLHALPGVRAPLTNVVQLQPAAPQPQAQAPATVVTDDGASSLPTTVIAPPATSQNVYVYSNDSGSYSPASYYPYDYSYPYYSAPFYGYGYVSYSPIFRFRSAPRFYAPFGGGFHGGFSGGFHGGFGGGFHGGGGGRR